MIATSDPVKSMRTDAGDLLATDRETGDPSLDQRDLDRLFSATYEGLRRIASSVKHRGDADAPVSPTTLVNEAWLKFSNGQIPEFKSPLHFKRMAARAMRQILVEAARRRDAIKRGGDGQVVFVAFDDFAEPIRCDKQILALNDSLDKLAKANPRQAKLVESRFFGGMDMSETAQILGISPATAGREWRAAKAWLISEIRWTN